MKKQANTEYAGKLADFGDATLDALAATQRVRKDKHRQVGTESCPSCGNMRFLRKGFYATLCEECHEDIARLAAPGRIWD